MNNTNLESYNTFFELLKVAVGNIECLSHTPSTSEWEHLFYWAKKQSLLGVCFGGIEHLPEHQLPGKTLLMHWLGASLYIKNVNEKVNKQCVEVQKRLNEAGFPNSILKGQGVAQYYPEHLKMLRQSGDIDVWVKGGMRNALTYAVNLCGKVEYDYINAHLPFFEDTEVELHWRVTQMQNLWKNHQLQNWVAENEQYLLSGTVVLPTGDALVVPSLEFNLFYILLHIYNHEFSEGIGLRQLMDYFFVL
ncbi:MAG: nucleotidyltransferase family protein, partial [Candidatus Cryptobacteroides sp.]